MNTSCITGRFAGDPELKTTNNGTPVCSFTLAVQSNYKKDTVNWIDCVAWRKVAEFIAGHFTKGSEIAIQGEIETRNYEDKNGNKRKAVEVNIDKAYFVGSKGDSKTDGVASTSSTVNIDYEENELDLPW